MRKRKAVDPIVDVKVEFNNVLGVDDRFILFAKLYLGLKPKSGDLSLVVH